MKRSSFENFLSSQIISFQKNSRWTFSKIFENKEKHLNWIPSPQKSKILSFILSSSNSQASILKEFILVSSIFLNLLSVSSFFFATVSYDIRILFSLWQTFQSILLSSRKPYSPFPSSNCSKLNFEFFKCLEISNTRLSNLIFFILRFSLQRNVFFSRKLLIISSLSSENPLFYIFQSILLLFMLSLKVIFLLNNLDLVREFPHKGQSQIWQNLFKSHFSAKVLFNTSLIFPLWLSKSKSFQRIFRKSIFFFKTYFFGLIFS